MKLPEVLANFLTIQGVWEGENCIMRACETLSTDDLLRAHAELRNMPCGEVGFCELPPPEISLQLNIACFLLSQRGVDVNKKNAEMPLAA